MQEDLRARSDARLESALRERALADPRDGYRTRLRVLREANPDLFTRALRHYEEIVLPGLAGDADPVDTWIEYGRFLGELLGPGRTVAVDPTGRAIPYVPPLAPETLVLHLPEDRAVSVMPLASPQHLRAPQQATYDLLVLGRERIL